MDWQGAFEVAACGGGRSGQCVRQMSPQTPITWDALSDPHALLGDVGWRNYTVSSDVLLETVGIRRADRPCHTQDYTTTGGLNAYHLRVSDTGAWSILNSNTNGNVTTLATARSRRWAPTGGTPWRVTNEHRRAVEVDIVCRVTERSVGVEFQPCTSDINVARERVHAAELQFVCVAARVSADVNPACSADYAAERDVVDTTVSRDRHSADTKGDRPRRREARRNRTSPP